MFRPCSSAACTKSQSVTSASGVTRPCESGISTEKDSWERVSDGMKSLSSDPSDSDPWACLVTGLGEGRCELSDTRPRSREEDEMASAASGEVARPEPERFGMAREPNACSWGKPLGEVHTAGAVLGLPRE